MERAVQICTSVPARKLRLKDRGLIADGYQADLVIFDPQSISDAATYEDPHQYPSGISFVLVNGQVVVENGAHSGKRPGAILRHTR